MHKGVKCLDAPTGRVYISRDVVFEEDKRWEWASGETGQRPESFMVEYNVHLDDAHIVAQPKCRVHHPTKKSVKENRLTPEEIAPGFRPEDFVTPTRDEAPT